MQADILKPFDHKGNVYSPFVTWLCSLTSSQYHSPWGTVLVARSLQDCALHASHLGFYLHLRGREVIPSTK